MSGIIRRFTSRLLLLVVLAFVVVAVAVSQPAKAAPSFNRAFLPNHWAEAAYKKISSPAQSVARMRAAYQKAATVKRGSVPAVHTQRPAAGAPLANSSGSLATTSTSTSTANLSGITYSPNPTSFWSGIGPAPLDDSSFNNLYGAT